MSADIQVYTGGPCMCNGYLVKCGNSYVAIDAPLGFADWVASKLPADAVLTDLLITHQHFDHVQGAAALTALTGCKVHACMPYSKELTLEDMAARSWGGGLDVPPFRIDDVFGTGCTTAEWGGSRWNIYHIPGHSPDGVAYECVDTQNIFCGDILFEGSVGRTDFPGGSMATLIRGIREKLLPLPHTTMVNSGHGPTTTIGEETLNNPYL
ncbi:MAG: MBL fold metallo-hydrolase [Akkermansia sp.]|nr:MBL fold metallo-hydrolase [Akkermansia sp.]